jgi:hypothetical protein
MDEAADAATRYPGFDHHEFPTCFTCGIDRDDGLRIWSGRVAGSVMVAAPWAAPDGIASSDGTLPEPIVWAALDCPGAWVAARNMSTDRSSWAGWRAPPAPPGRRRAVSYAGRQEMGASRRRRLSPTAAGSPMHARLDQPDSDAASGVLTAPIFSQPGDCPCTGHRHGSRRPEHVS